MCGKYFDMMKCFRGWHSRDPEVEYRNSKFYDYFAHFTNRTCQRCGSKHGPFYIVDLDVGCEDEKPWSMSQCNKLFLCKECHTDLRKWLNIPTQDIII